MGNIKGSLDIGIGTVRDLSCIEYKQHSISTLILTPLCRKVFNSYILMLLTYSPLTKEKEKIPLL